MTREEYERLLKSDYWKGYSYSLIKERNFTCEDCGRQFPNERNKLQVHHLVYRDVNPWSYRPDEVVVLCEECHKKRHDIKDEPKPTIQDDGVNRKPLHSCSLRHRQHFKFKYFIYVSLLVIVLLVGWNSSIKQKQTTEKDVVPNVEKEESHKTTVTKKNSNIGIRQKSEDSQTTAQLNNQIVDSSESTIIAELDHGEHLEKTDDTISSQKLSEKKESRLFRRKNKASRSENRKKKSVDLMEDSSTVETELLE